ncbi:hypothetical protein J2S44_005773 [Catenuloplanes niger]|uniref:Uncharacterized protein n=1 Tax=Catenuloplanes niger TaxID=587534 RepID=A0AAE3ZWR8_9ACTN|nr:hypothetical protein [Catenuloplanes niger]
MTEIRVRLAAVTAALAAILLRVAVTAIETSLG